MLRVVVGVTVPITAKTFLKDQLQELVRQGWDPHLVTSPGIELNELDAITGLTTHVITMKRDPAPITDAYGLCKWSRLIKRIRPDALVLSTPKASLLGLVAGWFHRIPVRVYHVRGLRAEGATGATRAASLLAERISAKIATDIVVDSHSLLGRLRQLQLLRSDQGVVLGSGSSCGVDTEYFRPPLAEEKSQARTKFEVPGEDYFVVGYLGRVTKDKGIAELIAAVKGLRGRNIKVHCVITGPVEQMEFQPLLDEPWISASESFQDPRWTYWACDVMCFPSYREGFPIAPLEAQARGVPVITTWATGSVDSVVHGMTGLLVDVAAIGDMANALVQLESSSDQRQSMGLAGRRWVEVHFTRTQVAGRWLSYLKETILKALA